MTRLPSFWRQQWHRVFCVDTETTGLNAAGANLVGVAMALAPGKACYVPLRHGVGLNDVVGGQGG